MEKFASRKFAAFLAAVALVGGMAPVVDSSSYTTMVAGISTIFATYCGGNVLQHIKTQFTRKKPGKEANE